MSDGPDFRSRIHAAILAELKRQGEEPIQFFRWIDDDGVEIDGGVEIPPIVDAVLGVISSSDFAASDKPITWGDAKASSKGA